MFIEDAEGCGVDGFRASDARARFREFAVHLHNHERAPVTWARGLDPADNIAYIAWMRATCPELQYCHNDWKASELAIREYPQWKPAYELRLERRRLRLAKRAALQAAGEPLEGE